MQNNKILLTAGLALLLLSCQPKVALQPVQIIPEPVSIIEMQEKPFVFDSKSKIVIQDESMLPAATLLKELLKTNIQIVTI